jgi:gliding motility-associated lipoprotein GldH
LIRNTDQKQAKKDERNDESKISYLIPKLLLPLLLLVGLCNCSDPSRVFEKNIDLPENIWLADSVATFEFEIKDAEVEYDLYYNIRNSLSYPYHNLYIRHTLEDSLGNMINSALQNMDLFDPITGKPLGEGLGDIFDHRILAISNQKFPRDGWYRFKMQQFMRQDSLPLILSVGLRVAVHTDESMDEETE